MKIEELNGKTISIARNEKLDVEIVVNVDEFVSSWLKIDNNVYAICEYGALSVANSVLESDSFESLKESIQEYWQSVEEIDEILKEKIRMKSLTKIEYFELLESKTYYQVGYLNNMSSENVLERIRERNLTVEKVMACPMMSLKNVRSMDIIHNVVRGDGMAADNSLLFEEKKGKISECKYNHIHYLIHEYDNKSYSVKCIIPDKVLSEYFVDCAKKQLDSAFRMGLDPYDYRIYVDGVDLDDLDEIGDIFANIELPDSFIDSEVYVEALKEIQQLTCDYVAEELDTVDYLNEYKMEVKI